MTISSVSASSLWSPGKQSLDFVASGAVLNTQPAPPAPAVQFFEPRALLNTDNVLMALVDVKLSSKTIPVGCVYPLQGLGTYTVAMDKEFSRYTTKVEFIGVSTSGATTIKCLVRDDNIVYKWNATNSTWDSRDWDNECYYGMTDVELAAVPETAWNMLKAPKIVAYTDSATYTPTFKITPGRGGVITSIDSGGVDLSNVYGLNYFSVNSTNAKYLISLDLGTTWLTYDGKDWAPTALKDIATKGMTACPLPSDLAKVFDGTRLDVAAYITDSYYGFSASMIDTLSPSIDNFVLTPTGQHQVPFMLEADVNDVDRGTYTYKIQVNGKDITSWSNHYVGENHITSYIEATKLKSGSNVVSIIVSDRKSPDTVASSTVAYTNGKPSVAITGVKSQSFKLDITDSDADPVTYKAYVTKSTGEKIADVILTSEGATPISRVIMLPQLPEDVVNAGGSVTLAVEATDGASSTVVVSAPYTPEFNALLFRTSASQLYNDEDNTPLRVVDFGTLYASQQASPVDQVFLFNNTGYTFSSVTIDSGIDPLDSSKQGVKVFIDETGQFATQKTQIHAPVSMKPGDSLTFYTMLDTQLTAEYTGVIPVRATATI